MAGVVAGVAGKWGQCGTDVGGVAPAEDYLGSGCLSNEVLEYVAAGAGR